MAAPDGLATPMDLDYSLLLEDSRDAQLLDAAAVTALDRELLSPAPECCLKCGKEVGTPLFYDTGAGATGAAAARGAGGPRSLQDSNFVQVAESGFEVLENYAGAGGRSVMDSVALLTKNGLNDHLKKEERALALARGVSSRQADVCLECHDAVVGVAQHEMTEAHATLAQYESMQRQLKASAARGAASALSVELHAREARKLEEELSDIRKCTAILDEELEQLEAEEEGLRAQFLPGGDLAQVAAQLQLQEWDAEAEVGYYYDRCATLSHRARLLSLSAEALQAALTLHPPPILTLNLTLTLILILIPFPTPGAAHAQAVLRRGRGRGQIHH
mmetsp:Transcript_22947/g.71324  ORF Transcript_22947/g.71324 Transcript_22947/m.71324 type:complete len:333 (+) Transcript_22947:156-1154(+)